MSITITSDSIQLASPFLTRTIQLEDGPFSCDIFLRPPETRADKPLHLDTGYGIPFEAAIQIDDTWHYCGVRHQHCTLWEELTNDFEVIKLDRQERRLGDCAILTMRSASLALELEIEYELSDRVPVMRKSVRVRNIGHEPIVIANVAVELIYRSRAGKLLHFLHDYRQEVEGHERFFAGFCDFCFPGKIDVKLAPEEVLESFNLYELFLPESSVAQAVWRGRVLRELAPWALNARETMYQFSGLKRQEGCSGLDTFRPLLDSCAEAGFEKIMFFWDQLFTNTGDYIPRPDLFPGGEAELSQLIQEIRQRGMKAGVYASYSIALPESLVRLQHLDWECCDQNGLTFDPGQFGNMCFLSGWGDYIKQVFERLCNWGFEEIQIDGPTDIPCWRQNHNHTTLGNYHYYNWLWERELFAYLQKRQVAFTIPRDIPYLLMGASAIPGGYKEEDFCHAGGRTLLENYRDSIHASRKLLPAWCSWGFLAVGNYHGNQIDISEEDPDLFEQGLASLFGSGHNRAVSGSLVTTGPVTSEILKRYLEWFKRWRYLFNSDCIELGIPGEDPIDGLLFTCPSRQEGLAILINPNAEECRRNLLFPLGFADIQGAVSITEYEKEYSRRRKMNCDQYGQLYAEVCLRGGAVQVLHFAAGEEA